MGVKGILKEGRVLFGRLEGEDLYVTQIGRFTYTMYKALMAVDIMKPIIVFAESWETDVVTTMTRVGEDYVVLVNTEYIKVIGDRKPYKDPLPPEERVKDLLKHFSFYNPEEDPEIEEAPTKLDVIDALSLKGFTDSPHIGATISSSDWEKGIMGSFDGAEYDSLHIRMEEGMDKHAIRPSAYIPSSIETIGVDMSITREMEAVMGRDKLEAYIRRNVTEKLVHILMENLEVFVDLEESVLLKKWDTRHIKATIKVVRNR